MQCVENAGTAQTVIDRLAALVAGENPRLPEDGQVLADGGKLNPDRFDKLADTVFLSVRKLFDDPQPGRMTERLKDFGFVFAGVFIEFFHGPLLVI